MTLLTVTFCFSRQPRLLTSSIGRVRPMLLLPMRVNLRISLFCILFIDLLLTLLRNMLLILLLTLILPQKRMQNKTASRRGLINFNAPKVAFAEAMAYRKRRKWDSNPRTALTPSRVSNPLQCHYAIPPLARRGLSKGGLV